NTKKCSKCKATGTLTYLRKEDSSETGICVDAATCTNTNTYYTDDTEPKMCKKCSESLTNCEQCTSPRSLGSSPACTKCATPNYLKTVDGTTTCVAKDACKDGFFPVDDTADSNKKKCLACSDENCDVCAASGANKCSKCKTSGDKIYLQKEADSPTGTCVNKAGCTGTNYIDETAKTCSTCASAGTTGCKTCAKTDGVVACASCEDDQKFGLNKKSCVAKCPDNASEKSGVCTCNDGFTPNEDSSACTQCHSSCLTCSAAGDSKCKSCKDGYFLGVTSGQTGKCISCGDATGSGGWTGVTGCAKCTKPASAGPATCTECNTELYLKTLTGGTPATSCVTADKCGEGFFATTVNNIKKCVSCSDKTNGVDGCEKCMAPGEGKTKPTCTKCSAKYLKTVSGVTTCETDCGEGYFKNDKGGSDSQTKVCVSCGDATNGVPNCAKCTLPSGATKPTCSECDSGYTLDSQANTCASTGANKSILSTGAIAGISVAAVVVVGGLVGFLCWWFVCYRKA
ncbi:Variant-specific surface protein, partial [Giardia duodenalis]